MIIFIFIFFLTIIVSYLLSLYASRSYKVNRKKSRSFAVLALLVVFLFMATRYDIGRDFQNYFFDYSTFSDSDYGFGRRFSFEYMNYIVLTICHTFKTGPIGYFVLTSFMTITLFFFVFKDKLFLLPYAIIVFFLCGSYTFAINGIRQAMAIFSVIYALTPVMGKDKPSLLHYIMWMGIAFICHNSALFFTPLYFLYVKNVTHIFNSNILVLIAVGGFLANQLGFSDLIPSYLFVDTENIYTKQATNAIVNTNASQLSIAYLINFIAYILPLFFADKIEKKYPESKKYFVLYAFGVALYYFVGANLYLIRLSYFLLFFNILVYPYFYSYFRYNTKNNLISSVVNIWFAIYFLGKMSEFWSMQIGLNPSVYGIRL